MKKVKFIAPVAVPTIGASGKTGNWRVMKPIIDYDKCIKCMQCWMYCPEGAITVENDMPKIDYVYCKGCGICANECPVKAIKMEKEV
ncbi:MAG: ferredoxin [Thermoprotei archaeon]|nr:MAG: ferredoxin [Thermoprotei archaeon]